MRLGHGLRLRGTLLRIQRQDELPGKCWIPSFPDALSFIEKQKAVNDVGNERGPGALELKGVGEGVWKRDQRESMSPNGQRASPKRRCVIERTPGSLEISSPRRGPVALVSENRRGRKPGAISQERESPHRKKTTPTGRPTGPIQRRLDRHEPRDMPLNGPSNALINEGETESAIPDEWPPRSTSSRRTESMEIARPPR